MLNFAVPKWEAYIFPMVKNSHLPLKRKIAIKAIVVVSLYLSANTLSSQDGAFIIALVNLLNRGHPNVQLTHA